MPKILQIFNTLYIGTSIKVIFDFHPFEKISILAQLKDDKKSRTEGPKLTRRNRNENVERINNKTPAYQRNILRPPTLLKMPFRTMRE